MAKKGGEKLGETLRVMGLVGMMTQAVLTFVVGSVGGYFLGRFLDEKLGTEPLLSLVFLFAGFGAGIYMVIWALLKFEKRKKPADGHD